MGPRNNYSLENAEVSEKPDADEEETERGTWGGKLDFLLSAIGYAVGLGNVWRFPYRAYAHGGASFLIPYLIMLTIAGLPLFFMEMAFGQFGSLGPISVWRALPLFKGIGWAMVFISGLVVIYYNMIIAYTVFYTFASFTKELPWQHCKQEWIDKYGCREREGYNETLANLTAIFCDSLKENNLTDTAEFIGNCSKTKTPSEIYWEREVLDISEGVDHDSGVIRWQLVLCLLFSWIVIFLCLIKGIKSSGKVVYVTATFPYIVLVILLIRNVTLPGAWIGIEFYIVPKWDKLLNIDAWFAAAVQIFYSLGVAFGGLETMASYNKFNNNVCRDSIIVAILNCATSIFAGFVIFSVIGFMAHKTGLPVDQVASSGPGLAFIAYPEGIAMMPVGQLWSVLFFVMLFTLGLDSQFAMMETIISALTDEYTFLRKGKRKIILTLFICVTFFLLGLPLCSRAGMYIINIYENYSASISLLVVSLLEVLGITWIYGYKRFSLDIEMMIGYKPNIYWLANWIVITPLVLLFILITSVVQYSPLKYGDNYVYPDWAINIGWGMTGVAIAVIPIVGFIEYCKAHGFVETMKKVLNPVSQWGPALERNRTGIYANTSTDMTSGMKYKTNGDVGMNGFAGDSNTAYIIEESNAL